MKNEIDKIYDQVFTPEVMSKNGWDKNQKAESSKSVKHSKTEIMQLATKQLSNIINDANNGWIRIKEDGSNLPTIDGDYWFYTIHSKITKNHYNPFWDITHKGRYINAYTHYQPIINPEPPIY